MKLLMTFIAALFALLMSTSALAVEPVKPTVSSVRAELIEKLKADGALTPAAAEAATAKYVNDSTQLAEEETWTRFISLSNVIKVIAILFFLIAFSGLIMKFIAWGWMLIIAVPVWVYQLAFGSLTATMTVAPALLWASQAYYVALFGAFANLLIIGWVFNQYPAVRAFVKRLFSLGVPEYVVASFWGVLYFAALSIVYSSQVFGFFSVVCMSAMFGFGLYYMPGVLFLSTQEKALPALIFSHMLILLGYSVALINGAPYLSLFRAGFEYYTPIALGVAFLIAVSPFLIMDGRANGSGLAFLALIVSLVLGNIGFGYYDLKTIGTILNVFGFLLLIEWVMYASWHGGFIIGTAVTGAVLYGVGMYLESNWRSLLALVGG